jgi:hypothetical protein
VRKTTNQNKEEKPMDLIIPETNKKQFNELAEKIIDELAKVFPVGIELYDFPFIEENEELFIPTINYLIHSGYLLKSDEYRACYLTEKSVKSLNNRTGFPPIVP